MKNVNCFIGDLECKFLKTTFGSIFFFFFAASRVALVSLEREREFLTLFFCGGE